MMVVPPGVGSNGLAAVGTLPLLPLPEGKQEVTPFECGGHLRREALLEVPFPAGIVGIVPFAILVWREIGRLCALKSWTAWR